MYRASPADGIAWITGASSGIGQGVALELVKRGFRVAATARRESELAALARASDGKISAFPGDVTDAARIGAAVAAIEAAHGPIALAFLNAGAYFPDRPDAFGGSGFQSTFALNVGGTANCLGALLPRMQARRRGQIAINASLAGYAGLPQAHAYGASKAALIHLAEGLRLSLRKSGITVQVVNPGFVRTAMTGQGKYPMPYVMPLEDACRRICDGLERGGFEITFPRRLAWPMKVVGLLPYPLYFAIIGKATGAGRSD